MVFALCPFAVALGSLQGILETSYPTGAACDVQPAHTSIFRRILVALDTVTAPGELNCSGYKLRPLKGSLKGHWSDCLIE